MPKSIRVNILGREYALRVKEDHGVRTREVAEHVDARMTAFRKAHPEQAKLTTAVITALALADELHHLRRQHAQEHTAADAEMNALADRLAEVLPAANGVPRDRT